MVRETQHQRGFTLVELAMVIVIIGLIVGGVLVGQDLIKAAQIRATIAQLQGYDAAVNTFRTKYDGLPGDLTRATNFGLGDIGNGDGNGVITDETFITSDFFTGEIPWFWAHLSAANLVAGNYPGTGGGALGTDIPDSKLKKGGITAGVGKDFITDNATSLNFYYVGIADRNDGNLFFGDGMTPVEAFGIDSKLDDGFPDTGIVVGTLPREGPFSSGLASGDAGILKCTIDISEDGSTFGYNISVQNNTCAMRVRISG